MSTQYTILAHKDYIISCYVALVKQKPYTMYTKAKRAIHITIALILSGCIIYAAYHAILAVIQEESAKSKL